MVRFTRGLLVAVLLAFAPGLALATNITVKDAAGSTQTLCTVKPGSADIPCHTLVDSGGTDMTDTVLHLLKVKGRLFDSGGTEATDPTSHAMRVIGVDLAGNLLDPTAPIPVTCSTACQIAGTITANQGSQGTQQWLVAFRDKPTYSSTAIDLVPASGATDFWTITGSGTKVGRIVGMRLVCVSTSGGPQNITLLRRSTADTSGTSSAPTIGQSLSSDAPATLTVKAYTANPTLGTLVANLRSSTIMCGTAGTGEIAAVPLTFGEDVFKGGRPMTLLTTSELYAVSYEGQTPPAGTKFRIDEIHSEE